MEVKKMPQQIIEDMYDKLYQENERLKEWKEDLLSENIELENARKEAVEILHNLNDTLPLDIILSEIDRAEYILQNGSNNE